MVIRVNERSNDSDNNEQMQNSKKINQTTRIARECQNHKYRPLLSPLSTRQWLFHPSMSSCGPDGRASLWLPLHPQSGDGECGPYELARSALQCWDHVQRIDRMKRWTEE